MFDKERQKRRPLHILVVDDDRVVLEVLRDVLSNWGYQVETAASGEEALGKIRSPGKFNILITDIYMPGMDGMKLLSKAKEIDKYLEVIVITGHGSVETAVEAMRKGAFDYIHKPLHMDHMKLVVAKTVERSRLRREAQKAKFYRYKSSLDALTQLYNHSAFFQLLQRELSRSKRYNRPLTLLFIDVDHFKDYNDTFGHQAGDIALVKVSLILKKSSRQIDLVARYGGEEFAVIAPETSKDQAILMAERLRSQVEQAFFADEDGHLNKKITISLGLSGFPEDGDTARLLVKRADEALYSSKSRGRNRFSFYDHNNPSLEMHG